MMILRIQVPDLYATLDFRFSLRYSELMRRGTVKLTREQLSALIQSIDIGSLPDALANRFSGDIPQDKDEVSVLLSEEEAELLLDALDQSLPSDPLIADVYERIQSFLVSLRAT